jgi:hypothetical protein
MTSKGLNLFCVTEAHTGSTNCLQQGPSEKVWSDVIITVTALIDLEYYIQKGSILETNSHTIYLNHSNLSLQLLSLFLYQVLISQNFGICELYLFVCNLFILIGLEGYLFWDVTPWSFVLFAWYVLRIDFNFRTVAANVNCETVQDGEMIARCLFHWSVILLGVQVEEKPAKRSSQTKFLPNMEHELYCQL